MNIDPFSNIDLEPIWGHVGAQLGPKLGPSWVPNWVQIGPQTVSNFITHSMLFLKPSWSVLKPFTNSSWRSGRPFLNDPPMVLNLFSICKLSRIKRRWSVFKGLLGGHFGGFWGAILEPSWEEDDDVLGRRFEICF